MQGWLPWALEAMVSVALVEEEGVHVGSGDGGVVTAAQEDHLDAGAGCEVLDDLGGPRREAAKARPDEGVHLEEGAVHTAL